MLLPSFCESSILALSQIVNHYDLTATSDNLGAQPVAWTGTQTSPDNFGQCVGLQV